MSDRLFAVRDLSAPRLVRLLAAWLLVVGAAAAPARGLDPAEMPVHRHLLPPGALELLLAQGEVRLLPWTELVHLMEEGARTRRQREEARQTEAAAARDLVPFRFESLTVDAHQEQDGEDALLKLRAEVTAEGEGWKVIPLLGAGPVPAALTVRREGDAGARGYLVPLEGGYAALLPGAGRWSLELEAYAPVLRKGHLRTLAVNLPPVPGALGSASLPGADLEVLMDPAPETQVLGVAEGRTRTRAPLPPGSPFQVHWFPRDAGLETGGQEGEAELAGAGLRALGPRLFSTVSQTLVLGHGRMDALVRLDLEVLRAPVSRVQVRADGTLENLECVRDPSLVERVDTTADGLSVEFKGGRQGHLSLTFTYRFRAPASSPSFEVTVPRLRVVDAASERSYLWVGRSTNVRIEPSLEGMVEELGDDGSARFPAHPAAPEPLNRYRLGDPEARVKLAVQRYPDAEVTTRVIDMMRVTTEFTGAGRTRTTAAFTVRDRRRAPLRVGLPPDAVPTGFWRGGQRVHPAVDAGGVFSLPLRDDGGGVAEEVAVRIDYHREAPGGRFGQWGQASAELLRVDAPVMDLDWTLEPPQDYRLRSRSRSTRADHRGALRVRRQMVTSSPDGDQAVRVTVGYASPRAREVERLLGALLGLVAGWLLCAVLVGRLPLPSILLLGIPEAVSWLWPELELMRLYRPGLETTLAAGVLVGLRRTWSTWRAARAARQRHAAEVTRSVVALRDRLSKAIEEHGEPPPPDTPPPPDPPPARASEAGPDSASKGGE